MKRLILGVVLASTLLTGFWLTTGAEEETVNTTVTPTILSIRIMESNAPAYGNVPLGTVGAVPSPDSFTIENNGTEIVDLDISGSNSNKGWTLSTGTGPDQYVHYYSTGVAPVTYNKLSSTMSALLKSDLAVNGQQSVLLKLDMPTSTTNTGQHIMPVKVLATVATP